MLLLKISVKLFLVMRNEEFAYQEGYRISKEGNLYHLNGRDYKTNVRGTREKFAIRRNNKIYDITIARLQAFQKFGKELYNFRLVRHLNSNSLDCSFDNIALGKGSEIITPELFKMRKTQRAFHLGYSVSKDGILLLNNVDVSEKIYYNKFGYQMFSIPFKKNRMDEVFIHKLQAFQKFGKKVFDHDCVRHLNGNCVDNSWRNIAVGSFKENSNDVSLEVKAQQYLKSAHKQIKYPIPLRNELRRKHMEGLSVKELENTYNIPNRTVYSIVRCDTIV